MTLAFGSRALAATAAPVALMPRVSDYTLLWWAGGPPQIMGSKRSPAHGTLCFQSDYASATQRWQQTYNLEPSVGRMHTIDFTRAISKS